MKTERVMNQVEKVVNLCEDMINNCIIRQKHLMVDIYLEDSDRNSISWTGVPDDVYVTGENEFVLEAEGLRIGFNIEDVDSTAFDIETEQYTFTRGRKMYIFSDLA